MFYVIGLGLCDEKDITVRGLEVSSLEHHSHYLKEADIHPVARWHTRQSKAPRACTSKHTQAS